MIFSCAQNPPMRKVLTMVHKVQSDWSYYLSNVILLCLLTSLTTLQSWRLPYCSLHISVMLLSNGLSIYFFLQLCERQSNCIPLREIFFWPLGIKCQPPPFLTPSLTKFSLSFFLICIHEIYNLIYEVYYFIYSFWFLSSFSEVHKLCEVKIFACFAHCFFSHCSKRYLTLSNSFIIVYYGVVRCFREGNGTPLQYSCLKNPMDRGAW